MKNLLQIIFISIITSLLFSACGKQMSITKRKYNKGYYVSHTNKKQGLKSQTGIASVKAESLQPIHTKLTEQPAGQKEVQLTALAPTPPEIVADSKENAGAINKIARKNYYKVKPLEKLLPSQVYTSELKRKMNSTATSEDALSLLWIIIVVLLILYLIGLLAGGWGLGWAIHILVIVAVVLLILWLLRIL